MFGLKQTFGWKFNPDVEYMTRSENSHFKELVKAGVITHFRIGSCERCKADVPNSKKFCSRECFEFEKEAADDTDGEMD